MRQYSSRRSCIDATAAAAPVSALDEVSGTLAATLAAALASLAAIVAELSQRTTPCWSEALAGLTVVQSWMFARMIFATHDAHEFCAG